MIVVRGGVQEEETAFFCYEIVPGDIQLLNLLYFVEMKFPF